MLNKCWCSHSSIIFLLLFIASCNNGKNTVEEESEGSKPNIILFYVDDLGYGDIGCYGAKGVNTPHVDSLARQGLRFTDAHCTSATCTPSRYSLLTGSYAFRNNAAILPGDAPLIIDTEKETLPSMAQKNGYATAVVGKWHLGLGDGAIDWNTRVSPGPSEIGFDYSFLLPATGDRVPCVYMENQKVVGLDTADPIQVDYETPVGNLPLGSAHPELLKVAADEQHSNTIINGISRIGFMSGGTKAHWVDEDFSAVLLEKAMTFMGKQKENPFFLFFSFHDIHVPRMPHADFKGKSSMGSRGDAIAQMDWTVGQVMHFLEKKGLKENTLVIFTSDNGPVLDDGYADRAKELLGEHRPSGHFRGGKYSAFEAGTRVPTIAYWPGHIAPGESGALLSQVDFVRSFAVLMKDTVTQIHGDSQDMLSTLLGKSNKGKDYIIEESMFGKAIRDKEWKYIPANPDAPTFMENKSMETGMSDQDQLYHLSKDPKEQKNVAAQYPKVVERLRDRLEKMVKTNPLASPTAILTNSMH